MARNSAKIRMTAWVKNGVYSRVHERHLLTGATHQEIIEKALEFYLDHVAVIIRAPVPACTPNGLRTRQ